MMTLERPARCVEEVPVMFIATLGAAGFHMELPEEIRALNPLSPGARPPTSAEAAEARYLVAWSCARPAAVGAFIDRYDYHSSLDVRRVIHVSGSTRGMLDLIRWMRADADCAGRKLIGEVDARNVSFQRFLRHISDYRMTRYIVEFV
jgi:hypothetical protein